MRPCHVSERQSLYTQSCSMREPKQHTSLGDPCSDVAFIVCTECAEEKAKDAFSFFSATCLLASEGQNFRMKVASNLGCPSAYTLNQWSKRMPTLVYAEGQNVSSWWSSSSTCNTTKHFMNVKKLTRQRLKTCQGRAKQPSALRVFTIPIMEKSNIDS